MTKKNEFSDLVEKLDDQIKEKERQKHKLIELTKKRNNQKNIAEANEIKRSTHEKDELDKFRLKEKLFIAVICFVGGHLLLTPMYLKFSDYGVQIFLIASFSLFIIAVAIFDLG